ncbi:type VI secretion system protein ImpF [Noviherbaspirillum humi]|uniref:Type VI secretion system protein ImpF n=1 Tax=Noviherbaspirillum humi TaxID=1688639 RepID=A0A239DJR9_9BURK|nr:type VI secretion system baseplate subunit TssE [Noviherbaspirillum humi]SNS32657.1 type VI secretion system protein ImpF [Noviherbaspirillum humi]
MKPHSRQALILPSVLDRLFDDAPDSEADASLPGFDLAAYKRTVARDLEWLLNSRNMPADGDDDLHPQAHASILRFGIEDLSSLSLLDPDHRALLRDRLRLAIERHEPRLAKVRVALDAPGSNERSLRFRVDAVLKVHPGKPPVSFDAMLQLASSACRVRDC